MTHTRKRNANAKQGFDPEVEIAPGQAEYEADVRRRPTYDGGAPRKTWGELDDIARWSWARPKA